MNVTDRGCGGGTNANSAGVGCLRRSTLLCLGLCLAGTAMWACGDDGEPRVTAPIAVLSAFPAELARVAARVHVGAVYTIDRWRFRRGILGGREVILAVTGIGRVNAAAATRILLDRFPVRGIVVCGVAGGDRRIGDVLVPAWWQLPDGSAFAVHSPWLEAARQMTSEVSVRFFQCTEIPDRPERPQVCMEDRPKLIVGGWGLTDDPFAGRAAPCDPRGGEVFGCDLEPGPEYTGAAVRRSSSAGSAFAGAPMVQDMETAAIAQEAARRGVPFIAFRSLSDGAGDPLGLPGFPAQFFVYYRLAARNAAVATMAFLEHIP